MSTKKRHHFVPKFYLKNFSPDSHSINICNMPTLKIINGGNFRQQCYKKFFYGKDGKIEDGFMELENVVAPILKKIILSCDPPQYMSEEYNWLVLFTILQSLRTQHASEWNIEVSDKIAKIFLRRSGKFSDEELDSVRILPTEPIILPIQTAFEIYFFALDLQCKVLINATKVKFITSDNPVIFHNQFSRYICGFTNVGVACAGLQIFYPISPEVLLFFYDAAAYRVGTNKEMACVVNSEHEIQSINNFQYLSAFENIYFSGGADLIEKEACSFSMLRKKDLAVVEEINTGGFKPDNYVYMRRHEKDLDLRVRCVSIRPGRKERGLDPPVRNPELIMLHDHFSKLVDSGKFKEWEFKTYLEEIRAGNEAKVSLPGQLEG